MGTFNWRVAASGVTTKVKEDGLHASSDGTAGFVTLRKGFNSVMSIREETFQISVFEVKCRIVGNADNWQPIFRIDHYDSHHRHHVGTERGMTVKPVDGEVAAFGIEPLPFDLPRNWIADIDFIIGWTVPAGQVGKVVMQSITTWADR